MWIDDKLDKHRGWLVWETGDGVWWLFNWSRHGASGDTITFQAVDNVVGDRPQAFSRWVGNSDAIISHMWEALTPKEAKKLWTQISANPVPIVIRVAL